MPMPRSGESKKEFVSRAIPLLIEEGRPQDQAIAIANSMYAQHKKERKYGKFRKMMDKGPGE